MLWAGILSRAWPLALEHPVGPVEDQLVPAPLPLLDPPGRLAGVQLNEVRVRRVGCPLAGRMDLLVINDDILLGHEALQPALGHRQHDGQPACGRGQIRPG